MYGQKRKTTLFSGLAVLLLTGAAHGGEARDLSLEDAVAEALAANTGLRVTRQGELAADAALRQARGKNGVSVSASDSLRWGKTNNETAQS